MSQRQSTGDGGDRVEVRFACPGCGEDRLDQLVWTEDEEVRCATCGTVYDPADEPRPTLVYPAPTDDGPRAA